MSIASSSFMVEESGPCVVLAVRHRTVVASIEVELLLPSSAATEAPASSLASLTYVLWALAVPKREMCFADGFYTVTAPVPLGHLACQPIASSSKLHQERCRAVLSLSRWELYAGTRVVVALALPETDAAALRRAMEAALGLPTTREMQDGATLPHSCFASLASTRWRLCGTQLAAEDKADELTWQPLLHRRWYELKSYVRQGTVVPYYTSGHRTGGGVHGNGRSTDEDESNDDSDHNPRAAQQQHREASPMYAGDVREADGVSVNRQCILWANGVVGLLDEVKVFYRVYQSARPEKTIRVRRFPHRFADVIGEVPHGQALEACGRTTDPFTQEQYVQVYLPADPSFAHHIATYDLTFVDEGRYVWGWSKLAGSSGLPLLAEVQVDTVARENAYTESNSHQHNASSPAASPSSSSSPAGASFPLVSAPPARTGQRDTTQTEVIPLVEPTFYTPVREGRAVRIRKRPSTTSATIREMETNEVRAAVALVTVPPRLPTDASLRNNGNSPVPHVFVEWQQGGYSLLRNAVECFLVPVVLSHVPRRFPIRTRSGVGGDDAEAVVDLTQRRRHSKRRRSSTPSTESDTDAELKEMLHAKRRAAAGFVPENDSSLLSPHALPASLQEALRKGVVRLEDLPPLRGPDGGDEEASWDGSDDDGF